MPVSMCAPAALARAWLPPPRPFPLVPCCSLTLATVVSQDEFPGVFRFSVPVMPSDDDHVVTSPYNALLAASCLITEADCVLPLENQALLNICERLAAASGTKKPGSSITGGEGGGTRAAARPWDAMNGLAANLLLHVTSSVRFAGSLNLDLNDITTNLVGEGCVGVTGMVVGGVGGCLG